MANRVGKYMEDNCGIRFLRGFVPDSLEVLENGKRLVKWGEHSEEFDTVMLAIGRTADTKDLNLEAVGVKVNPENSKILCNEAD
jgi:thioredoxin reductase (NADPH)